MLNIIASIDLNNAIGYQNQLLHKIPEDLAYFRQKTINHAVIMGYNTYKSIGKPLTNRLNIVITSDPDKLKYIPVYPVKSLIEAIDIAYGYSDTIWIIGGESVYKQALPIVDNLYITLVKTIVSKADTYFPYIDLSIWNKELLGLSFYGDIELNYLLYSRKKRINQP